MMWFFLVILKLVSWATFVFAVITHELVVHVIFCFNVILVTQWGLLGSKLMMKSFSCDLLTRALSEFRFCSDHTWTCNSCYSPFQCDTYYIVNTFGLRIDDEVFFLWFFNSCFWANFVFAVITHELVIYVMVHFNVSYVIS